MPWFSEAQLVVTELVTNAFIHGEATSVSVGVELEGPKLRLTVCHEHNVKPDLPDVPVMPEATALQGRGLAIVGALAAIDVNVSAGSTCIEAVISM